MSIPQSGGGLITDYAQLAGYLKAGCKPAERWKIGVEHEKFVFDAASLRPVPYEGPRGIRALLEGIRDGFGWNGIHEGEAGPLIGLSRGLANISLEPGGQLELSGAPLDDLHQTAAEFDAHIAEVSAVARPLGLGMMALGATPDWTRADMPVMPKGRYGLMRAYMPKVGTSGLDMMFRSCTVQVNLDFADEADMVSKLRVALALQPLASALFANSPLLEGRPAGWKSVRNRFWRDTDKARSGSPDFVFRADFGFDAWVEWALDTPMYFVYRSGRYIDATGQSFRDFMMGRLPALPGERPTLSDWADHLTTLFPDARIKKIVEMRGADVGSDAAMNNALPALWVGLLYDTEALKAAQAMVRDWSNETRHALRLVAARDGLAGRVGDMQLRDLCAEMLRISRDGLRRRARLDAQGRDETQWLAPLEAICASGQTQADRLLAAWRANPDVSAIYRQLNLVR